MTLDEIRIGSIVRPAGDGEEPLTGRVIKDTSARFNGPSSIEFAWTTAGREAFETEEVGHG